MFLVPRRTTSQLEISGLLTSHECSISCDLLAFILSILSHCECSSSHETGDGWHISSRNSSSLLATRPFDPHLRRQWPIYVRDPGLPVFCVWGVPARDLADHRLDEVHREAGDMEASGRVLVCRLWFHPWCHWSLVLTVLWYYSGRPELPVTAVWVQTKRNIRKIVIVQSEKAF